MDGKEKTQATLFIKHLPSQLSSDDHKELLSQFGAREIKLSGKSGPLKYSAYALFGNPSTAEVALKRLHQLEICGRRLCVQYAKTDIFNELGPPKISSKPNDGTKAKAKESPKVSNEPDVKAVTEKIDSVCSKWNVSYPLNPRLKYSYPPPSVSILTNIANALATVPKFYVQVLHLMNKFNLPAPFGEVTPTPPLPDNLPPPLPTEPEIENEPEIEEAEMEVSSTEESELESSEGEQKTSKLTDYKPPPKRKLKRANKVNVKRPRIFTKMNTTPLLKPSSSSKVKVNEVFEKPETNAPRKIEMKQIIGSVPTNRAVDPITVGVNKLLMGANQDSSADTCLNVNLTSDPNPPTDVLSVLENEPKELESGGFGKIEPKLKDIEEEEEGEEEEWGSGDFISSRRLRRGRLSTREMRDLKAFKNYEPGEPTSRLYIKNITKQTSEKDLHYIFGRYVDWDNELEKTMFDIRLMKEGRMKGQAFVTLANADKANEALKETNAFDMNGKPLVVQFARSAKPKEDSKDAKSKEDSKSKPKNKSG